MNKRAKDSPVIRSKFVFYFLFYICEFLEQLENLRLKFTTENSILNFSLRSTGRLGMNVGNVVKHSGSYQI